MKVKISVTADDIRNGVPENGCRCPIALACRRIFPDLPELYVGAGEVIERYNPETGLAAGPVLAELPETAAFFIYTFDDNEPVTPFEFDLDVPDELIPAGTP